VLGLSEDLKKILALSKIALTHDHFFALSKLSCPNRKYAYFWKPEDNADHKKLKKTRLGSGGLI
jgi:hypothetical protein